MRTDSEIQRDVEGEFEWDPDIDAKDIAVIPAAPLQGHGSSPILTLVKAEAADLVQPMPQRSVEM